MSASLGEYIASFRIKELSQCLEQLGLSKRGRKLELQQRLLTYLADSQSSQGSAQPSSKLLKRNGAGRTPGKTFAGKLTCDACTVLNCHVVQRE